MKVKKLISALSASMLAVSCFVSAGAAETNLLTGGDFENEKLTAMDWKFPNTGVWYSNGKIVTDETTNSTCVLMSDTGLGQKVTVKEAGTYVMEIDVKVISGTAEISINNGSAPWPGNGTQKLAYTDASNNSWQTYKVEYTAAANQTLMPYVWVAEKNQAYIDNVKLYKKPALSYVGAVQTIDGTGDEINDKAYYGTAQNVSGTTFGFTVTGTYNGTKKSANITWNGDSGPVISGDGSVKFGVIIRGAAASEDLAVTYYQ